MLRKSILLGLLLGACDDGAGAQAGVDAAPTVDATIVDVGLTDGAPMDATPTDAAPVDLGAVDRDGDGVSDAVDNCPDMRNLDQVDQDGDGAGDVCDSAPDVANFALKRTSMVLFGGRGVDAQRTQEATGNTGQHEATGPRFKLRGRLAP